MSPDGPKKQRTIIRMLSTKFTPRPITIPPPPAIPSAYSKDCRDAALRARGLLPPRPRDLSVQEKEQDHCIPVVVPAPPQSPPAESPADLIKKEWVTKNNAVESTQRHRMNTFKFGGPSQLTLNPKSQTLPPTPPRSPVHPPSLLDQACLFPPPPTSLPPLPPKRQLPTPPQSPPSPESPRSRLTDDTPHSNINDRGTGSPRPTPAISLTLSNPSTSTSTSDDHLRDDSFAQLEETVSSIVAPSLDSSTTTTTDSSHLLPSSSIKSKKPGPGKSPGGLQVKTREGASIPVIVESPVEQHFSQDLEVVEEEDPSSHATERDDSGLREREKERVTLVPLRIPMTAPATVTITPAPNLNKSPTLSPADHHPPALAQKGPGRKRGMTDSTAGARKLLNPFKRDKDKPLPPSPTTHTGTEDAKPASKTNEGEKTSEPTLRPRRLSMSASLSNLRRSFVGTLSRPSTNNSGTAEASGKKSFNASHLPPSPTIPAAFAAQASTSLNSRLHGGSPVRSGSGDSSRDRDGVITPTPSARIARQPQPVVMYNRGSILLETANIEDDEVRRMTELAFLG